MKKNIKTMWFYSIVMFCVAILLILVSALSQTKITTDSSLGGKIATQQEQEMEQKAFNQTVQQSLSEIMEQNSKYEEQIARQQEEIKQLEQNTVALEKENDELKKELETRDMLIQGKNLYDGKQYKQAKDILINVNRQILNEDNAKMYDNLVNQLEKNGYKFN